MSPPNIIFGASQFGLYEGSKFDTADKVQAALDILQDRAITGIDTARRYPAQNSGTSEQILGQAALQAFTVDTKVWSMPGRHTPVELQKSIDESLDALRLSKVNILYLHAPDPDTPFEDVCKGINNIYGQGKFAKFGVSNFTILQLEQLLEVCENNHYIKPTVYQGQYNALARDAESKLLPLLRENGISFYSYSPAAGGAFNSSSTRMTAEDRIGDLWRAQYGGAMDSIARVSEAASRYGLTGHAVALNWVLHHSALKREHGDSMIIGARTLGQLEQTLEACAAGPLPQELIQLMQEVWDAVKDTAPPYTMFAKKAGDGETAMDAYLKK